MIEHEKVNNILDALADVKLNEQLPLLVVENDGFAARLLRSELVLDAAGLTDLDGQLKVPSGVVDLVLERRLAEMSDCDSMTLGPTAGAEAQNWANSRIADISRKLADLSRTHNLSAEVREQLGLS